MGSVRQLSVRVTLILLIAFSATGPAVAQSRFDTAALRLALRGIEPTPATRQAEDGWRRVLGLAPGTRVSIRTDRGAVLSGAFVSADATSVTFTRAGSSTAETVRRTELVEVQVQRPRRGSILGAVALGAAGVFVGVGSAIYLAERDCGGNCTDEKFLIGASLVGLPVGGAWLGYRAFSRGGTETIYARP